MRITKAEWAKLGTKTSLAINVAVPKLDAMNNLERRYANELDAGKANGKIRDYWYEGMKFRLADNTFYTPDFVVITWLGEVELHETKGWMREDANLKIKFVVETYPFPLVLVKWVKGIWTYKRYEAKRR